jgi:hypothetical protein
VPSVDTAGKPLAVPLPPQLGRQLNGLRPPPTVSAARRLWLHPCTGIELFCIAGQKAMCGGAIPVVVPCMAMSETIRCALQLCTVCPPHVPCTFVHGKIYPGFHAAHATCVVCMSRTCAADHSNLDPICADSHWPSAWPALGPVAAPHSMQHMACARQQQ